MREAALTLLVALVLVASAQSTSAQQNSRGFTPVPIDVQVGLPFHKQIAKVVPCEQFSYVPISFSIDWGDGTHDTETGGFVGTVYNSAMWGSHTYNSPGTFIIGIQVVEDCVNEGKSSRRIGSGTSTATAYRPPAVTKITVTGPEVQGGSPVKGNVYLAEPAPKGGVWVTIDVPDENSDLVTVPALVFIKEKETSVDPDFVVETHRVRKSPTIITFSAFSGPSYTEASKKLATTTLRIN
jgi:hypothetical protein